MNYHAAIIGGLILLGYSCSNSGAKKYQDITRPVRVMSVQSLEMLNKVYTGVVEAEEYSQLAFKLSGPLTEMNVDAGQTVKKGFVIAAIDPSDYQLKYEADKAAYITAGSQMERDKNLLKMEAISKQEFEVAQADYIKAKANYDASGIALNDTKLRAPFDGFIEEKYVENYQKVQPGEAVVKLVNPNQLVIRFILPETSVGLTRIPMKLSVEFDTYKGTWFDARLKEFVDASPDGGGIPVYLLIDDKRFIKERRNIYPGFSCRVNIETGNTLPDSYIIPLTALFEDLKTNETSVWVYDAGTNKVMRRKVKADQLFGVDQIMVREGLRPDDVIVVEGVDYITEGQVVNVLPAGLQ